MSRTPIMKRLQMFEKGSEKKRKRVDEYRSLKSK